MKPRQTPQEKGLALLAKGKGIREVGRMLKVHHSTVQKWRDAQPRKEGTIMKLRIDEIRRDGGTQFRQTLHGDVVKDYAEALGRGDKLPDPITFYDGTDQWLADGFHTCAAYEHNGTEEIEVNVRRAALVDVGGTVPHIFAGTAKRHGLELRPWPDESKPGQAIEIIYRPTVAIELDPVTPPALEELDPIMSIPSAGALSVACPQCRASAGEGCKNYKGKSCAPHRDRGLVAKAAPSASKVKPTPPPKPDTAEPGADPLVAAAVSLGMDHARVRPKRKSDQAGLLKLLTTGTTETATEIAKRGAELYLAYKRSFAEAKGAKAKEGK